MHWVRSADHDIIWGQASDVVLADITQLTFTCLKSTIETVEKGKKYVLSY